jgi:hypothetical protein
MGWGMGARVANRLPIAGQAKAPPCEGRGWGQVDGWAGGGRLWLGLACEGGPGQV